MTKAVKWIGWLLAVLLLISTAIGFALVQRVNQALVPPSDPVNQLTIASYERNDPVPEQNVVAELSGSFDWNDIATPPKSTRPWTRWWWPGGAVTIDTLQQQLQQLDDANFGGAEIQASAMGISAVTDAQQLAQVYQFDSPEFYQTLNALMSAAEQRDWQLDLTHLSGWPPGGPQINLADSLTELAYSEMSVVGSGEQTITLPKPAPTADKYLLASMEMFMGDFVNFAADQAKLLSVVAMPHKQGEHSANPLNLNDTEVLDASQSILLTERVSNGQFTWDVPNGHWKIIATYLLPSGEVPINGAQSPRGFVLDHLRQPQVRGHYEYAFGDRTGLPIHYGKGLRGFFNDSLEFRLARMGVEDIVSEFKQRRGYDLEPWLPAIYRVGVDNLYFSEAFGVHPAPEFTLTDLDERIRYDYSKTLSDLLIERFVETSAHWAQSRGLVSRGQSYGVDIDLLRALGSNTIPEVEQLSGGGSNRFLKMASSAAALYGKPLASAESFVWRGYDYSSSARKIKAAADKLMLAGINHIIYHGTPYPWAGGNPSPFGEEGWSPFSGVGNPGHFSSIVAPQNSALWPDVAALNQYIARSQNLLRQGKPDVDVLIYYPFLGYRSEPEDSDEILIDGKLADYDATELAADPLAQLRTPIQKLVQTPQHHEDERAKWLADIAPLLQSFERRGIHWAWVNAHAIDTGLVANGQMRASGGRYQAMLLHNVDAIDPVTLHTLRNLSDQGDSLYFSGRTPHAQPGFLNAEQGDRDISTQLRELFAQVPTAHIDDPQVLMNTLSQQPQHPLQQLGEAVGIRSYARALGDNQWVYFFANQSTQPDSIRLKLKPCEHFWWFDALEGRAWPAQLIDGELTLSLAGLSSRFLVIGVDLPANAPGLSLQPSADELAHTGQVFTTLEQWSLQVADRSFELSPLVDWRTIPELKFSSKSGLYRHKLLLDRIPPQSRYVLDLGLVFGSASVRINGVEVGRASIPPFTLDITSVLHSGANEIEVELLPPLINGFIGKARQKDPFYAHMQRGEQSAFGAGLIGPVRLIHFDNTEKTE